MSDLSSKNCVVCGRPIGTAGCKCVRARISSREATGHRNPGCRMASVDFFQSLSQDGRVAKTNCACNFAWRPNRLLLPPAPTTEPRERPPIEPSLTVRPITGRARKRAT